MKKFQNISELQEQVREFVEQRGWETAHGPKSLAMSVAIEAAELMEIFQWGENTEYQEVDPKTREHIGEEIADVMIYCMSLANQYHMDISEIICDKFEKNAKKYPISIR